MRPENKRMQDFLAKNGIKVVPRFLWKGSLKGCWRLWGKGQTWNPILASQLTALGFRDFDGKTLGIYSGSGGYFQTFVRGHTEFVGTERSRQDFTELL